MHSIARCYWRIDQSRLSGDPESFKYLSLFMYSNLNVYLCKEDEDIWSTSNISSDFWLLQWNTKFNLKMSLTHRLKQFNNFHSSIQDNPASFHLRSAILVCLIWIFCLSNQGKSNFQFVYELACCYILIYFVILVAECIYFLLGSYFAFSLYKTKLWFWILRFKLVEIPTWIMPFVDSFITPCWHLHCC